MARQTNGTSDYLVSASALTLSGSSKFTIAFWLACDAFNASPTEGDAALGYGDNVNGAFFLKMDEAGVSDFFVYDSGFSPWVNASFTRPSTTVWHHYVFAWDRSLANTAQFVFGAMDGAAIPGIANAFSGNASSTWANLPLNLMRYPFGSDYLNGRIAEVALYSGYTFNSTDASSLYNGGKGKLATSVQNSSLAYYWRLLGTTSPEPATTGSIAMTVTGATYSAHPFYIPDPVTIPIALPVPVVTSNYRVTPSPIAISIGRPAPALTARVELFPNFTRLPLLVPDPTLARIILPDPIPIPIAHPVIGVLGGGTTGPTGDQKYWHATYWHANYWFATYWAAIAAGASTSPQRYWAEHYWHANYWHTNYWPIGGHVFPAPVRIPLAVPIPFENVKQTLTPSPVPIPLVVATVTHVGPPITQTLTPSPIAIFLQRPGAVVDRQTLGFRTLFAMWLGGSGAGVEFTLVNPVTIPIPMLTAAPTLTAGAVALHPTPQALQIVSVQPAVARFILPDPVAVPITSVAPRIVYTVYPTPQAIPLVVTTPLESFASAPVPIPLVVPIPAVQVGLFTAHPDPVTIPLVVVAPATSQPLTVSPVLIPIRSVAPAITFRQVITPDPVPIPIIVAELKGFGVYIPVWRRRRR